jgi:hypothetical protein
MSCARPVSSEVIVDYWARALPADESERLEAHVFECDDCARRWQSMRALAGAIGEVVTRRGGAQLALTPRIAARLEASGLKLRTYRAGPGAITACSVDADDDLVVSWLSAELTGIDRIDLVSTSGGRELHHVQDLPIDRAAGRIGYALSGEVLRTWPSMKIEVRLLAVEKSGTRTIASYVFDHTAFSR